MNGKRGRKHSAFIVLLRLEKVCKIFMRIVPEKSNDNHFEVIEQWTWLCLIGNILKLPRSFGETLKRKKHTRELSAFAKVTAHTSEEQASSAFDQNKLWPNCQKLSPTCCQHSPQQQIRNRNNFNSLSRINQASTTGVSQTVSCCPDQVMIGLGSKNDCIYIPLYWLQVQCHGHTIKVQNDWRKRLMNSRLCDIMNRFAKSHFPLTYIMFRLSITLTWRGLVASSMMSYSKVSLYPHVRGFYSHVICSTDSLPRGL